MKNIQKISVLTLLIFVLSGFNSKQTKSGEAQTQNSQKEYQLVWQDEFNYEGEPSPQKWNYDIGDHGWGNNELQNYTDSRANSFVKDGVLTIRALKNNENHWTSARLVTKGKGDWLYGRFEVKAKLPAGTGTWPAVCS